ncbi:MAG: right-handed parallel beta-helix repeat-containing protein [Candidatus Hydrogenedentes bacterium]|nr:right-handed parallel beta-helix repeat-containing protein [Candidatus Hydrogenedentota bacterium]
MNAPFLHWLLPLAFLVEAEPKPAPPGATCVIAAHDSSDRSKAGADYVCDGEGDQEEINAAIKSLPEAGGRVLLMEGTFDIRRVEGQLGGVLIERSNVTLEGQGPSTKLVQAPAQETNVVRIIGSGVGHIVIRNLYVDANRDANPIGEGDPNVSHARFEFCGIKAFCARPGGGGEPCHNITIEHCYVMNARRLGIMLEGRNMRVLNNVLGNAFSDSVEILTGPGEIRGNYADITAKTHVAFGSDRGDNIVMANNIVHVRDGGDLDIGFRSWADSQRHVIEGNIVTVDKGGKCAIAIDARGYGAIITGNHTYTANDEKLLVKIGAGKTIVTGNVFENTVVEVDDTTGADKPIVVDGNVLENSSVTVKKGRVRGDSISQPATTGE